MMRAGWRGHRAAAGAAALAAVALTALALAGCGTGAGHAAPPAAGGAGSAGGPARPPATARPAATAEPSRPPLRAGEVGTLARVPWGQVGPGWALAEFTSGSGQAAGPVSLYMVDPAGGLYRVRQWPATTQPWVLTAWSGDKTRVLLQDPAASRPTFHELTIATGQVSTFTLPQDVTVLGYTQPDGRNILASQDGVVRYDLAGVFQARLSTSSSALDSVISSPDGRTEIVAGSGGVDLVGNAGNMIRPLPVPGGTAAKCVPVRWWNTADVLVSCTPASTAGTAARLWIVPASGAAPAALTPQRAMGAGGDFGDADAWQLQGQTYVLAEAGCGPPSLDRELPGTALQVVSPASEVIATSGDRMLVWKLPECMPGGSLAWLTPATGSTQEVLSAPPDGSGIVSAIAFSGDGQQPPPA